VPGTKSKASVFASIVGRVSKDSSLYLSATLPSSFLLYKNCVSSNVCFPCAAILDSILATFCSAVLIASSSINFLSPFSAAGIFLLLSFFNFANSDLAVFNSTTNLFASL